MAVVAMLNAYVSINATDVSSYVKSVKLSVEGDFQDTTAMGSTYKSGVGGLKSGSIALEFFDDVAATKIDSILWPLLNTVVAFEIRPDSAVVGTSNPKYTGSVHISQHELGASVGDVPMISATYPTSGTVTRATA